MPRRHRRHVDSILAFAITWHALDAEQRREWMRNMTRQRLADEIDTQLAYGRD